MVGCAPSLGLASLWANFPVNTENTGKYRQFAKLPIVSAPIALRKQSTTHQFPNPTNRENVHLYQRIIRIEQGGKCVRWSRYWLTEPLERAEADVRAKRSDRPF